MRQIKFRGLAVDTNEWVYGSFIRLTFHDTNNEDTLYAIFDNSAYSGSSLDETYIPIKPETVGEFTGLTDKNGKEIYEGDIVRCTGGTYFNGCYEYDIKGLITYSKSASFDVVKNSTYYSFSYSDFNYVEIIGNIHENPELL